METSCTRCGSNSMGSWCKRCDPDPYDRIKELEEWIRKEVSEIGVTENELLEHIDRGEQLLTKGTE